MVSTNVCVIAADADVLQQVIDVSRDAGALVRVVSSIDDYNSHCGENSECVIVELIDECINEPAVQLAPLKNCEQPFIVISSAGNFHTAVEAMRLGALDCLLKPVDVQILKLRLREAFTIDATRRQFRTEQNAFCSDVERLTNREREVLALVCDGKLTKEIAKTLEISVKTVEVHRSNIVRKMRLSSMAELIFGVAKFGQRVRLPLLNPSVLCSVPAQSQ